MQSSSSRGSHIVITPKRSADVQKKVLDKKIETKAYLKLPTYFENNCLCTCLTTHSDLQTSITWLL
jgi:hypothetical protein